MLNFCDFIQVYVFTTNHHLNICLSIFPFDAYDKLWVLIRPVPEVSLLVYFLYQAGHKSSVK